MQVATSSSLSERDLRATPETAPLWRREPYRVLFPLGIALTWAGVGHWLLLALGVFEEYRSIFHAMAQIQGFIICFAVGFLFTFIPRRTGTSPPANWEMLIAIAAPVGIAACAWLERWALSQVFWLVLMGVVITFALRRIRKSQLHPRGPSSFVWVPISLLLGVAAAILTGGAAIAGEDYMWLHDLGRGLLLQGMFTGLIIGIGGMLLPVITRGEPFSDGSGSAAAAKSLHILAALVFITSFWIEFRVSISLGFALRALVAGGVLWISARPWRGPTLPGLHRRLAWLASWILPLGYAFVAALPQYRRVGLHIVFIGGFAAMALAVATHVVLAHGGRSDLLRASPRRLRIVGLLLLLALIARAAVDLNPVRFKLWLGLAASLFLAATASWLALVVPTIFRPFQPRET